MTLPTIRFDHEMLTRFEDAIKTEWITTNGLGGYASSTVLGINTRKYHGLLVAALDPPGERRICLAKLDEEVTIGNSFCPLGSNEFESGVFPQGYLSLTEFSLSPFPRFAYTVRDVDVKKTIFLPYEKNAAVTVYNISNRNSSDVKIRIFPLINWRGFHSVTNRWSVSWNFAQRLDDRELCICFSVPESVLMMKIIGGKYLADQKWVEKLFYREEAMRAESRLDDCCQTGYFEVGVEANKRENFAVTALTDKDEANARKILGQMPDTMYDMEALFEHETKRPEHLLVRFHEQHEKATAHDWLNWLILAADMFVVRGQSDTQRAIIAGYHWFDVWGRDSLISLPGLMLVTGRFEEAKKVFLTFKAHCKEGLIPNFIPDQPGEAVAYNAADSALWYVNAVLQYLKYTGDFRFVQEHLWETLKTIVEKYVKGTAFNIHMDNDGLISHDSSLTWMDAVVDGQPVTPRAGKAVEVQALWYNALKSMKFLAKRFNEEPAAESYESMATKVKESFVEKFWNPEKSCLFDVISETAKDDSLRPNQIIAVALDFAMLDNAKNEKIVDVVHHELLTPYGLRTLSRKDPRYVGIYAGDRRSRDRAYHNGIVWPWLLGPFAAAFLKTKGYAEYRREYALSHFLLRLFSEQLYRAGVGVISEIFDGESPHAPRGCVAQAWSIAEPLRAYVEGIMQNRPRYEREVLQSI